MADGASSQVSFRNLEHTATCGITSQLEAQLNWFKLSDANVMNSQEVSQMVLCFLVSGGTSPCASNSASVTLVNSYTQYNPDAASDGSVSASPAFEADQQEAKAPESSGTTIRHFLANSRLEILPPQEPLKLAEPNEIQLRIHGRVEGLVDSSQAQSTSADPNTPRLVFGSPAVGPVLYHPDGSPYVRIVPMRLGKVELTLGVSFTDGGAAIQKIMVEVGPSQKRPQSIIVGPNWVRDELKLLLSLTGSSSRGILNVYAKYSDIDRLITIDPALATYRIINWDGRSSPIDLDGQTGVVTAVHPGQALVEISFAGRRNLTCVDVEKNPVFGISYMQHSCQTLLSGEKLGPQE